MNDLFPLLQGDASGGSGTQGAMLPGRLTLFLEKGVIRFRDILKSIRAEFRQERFSPAPGRKVHMTVGIGVAQYWAQEDINAFVHRVDQLMYQGKRNGKDRVCAEP